MTNNINNLRVAFFPDSYLEVNGAAMTCQKLVSFVKKRDYPFLCVHAGPKTETTVSNNLTYLSLKRSSLAIPMDETLAFDPLFSRHIKIVEQVFDNFRPDLLHLTGLNDVSIIAAWIGHKRQIPLIGSWHTNLHEFATRRLQNMFRFLPDSTQNSLLKFVEKQIFWGAVQYYKIPKVVLAPNQELVEALRKGSGRTAFLMGRGVDTEYFSPTKRTVEDGIFRLGFVGRLRAEKNVRLLEQLEKRLFELGKTNFKFLIVGEGNERQFLEKNMKTAEFTGFLSGEKLAESYANMDVFIFPSETDAFGNVAQEAMASGVPVIVTNLGGPKFIIKDGETGFIAENLEAFVNYSVELMENPDKLAKMKQSSRDFVIQRSWETVFEQVYEAYNETLKIAEKQKLNKSISKFTQTRKV